MSISIQLTLTFLFCYKTGSQVAALKIELLNGEICIGMFNHAEARLVSDLVLSSLGKHNRAITYIKMQLEYNLYFNKQIFFFFLPWI